MVDNYQPQSAAEEIVEIMAKKQFFSPQIWELFQKEFYSLSGAHCNAKWRSVVLTGSKQKCIHMIWNGLIESTVWVSNASVSEGIGQWRQFAKLVPHCSTDGFNRCDQKPQTALSSKSFDDHAESWQISKRSFSRVITDCTQKTSTLALLGHFPLNACELNLALIILAIKLDLLSDPYQGCLIREIAE